MILEGVGKEGQNVVNRGQLTGVGVLSINNIIWLYRYVHAAIGWKGGKSHELLLEVSP